MRQLKQTGNLFHGVFALLVLTISTCVIFIPFFTISLLKLFPNASWRHFCTKKLHSIASAWIDFNNFYLSSTKPAHIDVSGLEAIQPSDWYLIVANHQSWLDIVLLQYVFNKSARTPLLKFFIKSQLIWIPILGFCWWAMGYPFMKRHSKEYIAKYPHKKGEDLKATLKAVDKFKTIPSSIVSFVEGTRFTAEKSRQHAAYQYLLKPKAGGISFVIGAMHKEIDSLLDVTIVYPNKQHSIWDFLCHRIHTIKIHIRRIPIPAEFRNTALLDDEEVQSKFRDWLNDQWLTKDLMISDMRSN